MVEFAADHKFGIIIIVFCSAVNSIWNKNFLIFLCQAIVLGFGKLKVWFHQTTNSTNIFQVHQTKCSYIIDTPQILAFKQNP